MRFIGNKELIAPDIKELLAENGLLDKGLTLCDAFCGTGAVSDLLKDSFDLVVNDSLKWCTVYTKGRVVSGTCTFSKLGFDPFAFLNSNKKTKKGFFFRNYSPTESSRMYFMPENAGRIDYFRATIETWRTRHLIDDDEYCYLLASLIESVSRVSNTAGVYGAFLKHWDPRAKRAITFSPVEARRLPHRKIHLHNEKIEDIIDTIDCDILYLDPPYTQNQYGTQYHLLETLVLNDNPPISPITGSRPTAPMRSDWSKDIKKHILFDKVVSRTKAKHIICSYSSDGFMSQSYIAAVLKRYGTDDSFTCKKISYDKYTNFKSRAKDGHFEYLFYIRKKPKSKVYYTSPLNYIGSKTRMLPFLMANMPDKIETFVDAFGGGFNVGINSNADRIVYNDYNHIVKNLIESFRVNETYDYVQYIRRQIKKYGLEKENAETYMAAREYYNALPIERRDPRLLYTVIMYGFNQQIRFNGGYEFNNPVGMRWFNEKVLEKLISFSGAVKSKNIVFKSVDYADLVDEIRPGSFVYMDPPYRLTTGAYNDGKRGFKGWDAEAEKRMFEFAEKLDAAAVKFMISYVIGHKGKVNEALKKWLSSNSFRVIECDRVQGIGRNEVVIVNYA
ncbi:Dam family site-specific DNA-(adenine-N6)-methyltransferase [Microvirga terrestris]|uniref:site-specific DNA-methyltransferase (adenine-specific) n=1 Tax=Microvirga terrestris TaxID=2791024 RepID=A0ABS0HUW7_9HYPH|nr:Dam family site-specific DNA-(adenine-N6)-methyltransferase [Microvirga terrestris]MBF9197154.1 Dam family site-specific DNA-(adenine-N6)-methyltransferase [Microvirga terrestris]